MCKLLQTVTRSPFKYSSAKDTVSHSPSVNVLRSRPCYENNSQTGHIPLKCENFNVQTSSELQPHSRRPTSEGNKEFQSCDWAVHALGCWGWRVKDVFQICCSLSWLSLGECIGGWLVGVGVAHSEPLGVHSTVRSSAHWMDGDHSLGGACMPSIPRPWHVCVSVCMCGGGRSVCHWTGGNNDGCMEP